MTPLDAARALAEAAMACLALRPVCRVALCGGPQLAALIDALRALPACRRLDWPNVHVFATDESWDASAMRQLATLPLPRANLVRPRVAGIGRLEAARDYEQALRAHFSLSTRGMPAFDVLVHDGSAAPAGAVALASAEIGRLVAVNPRGSPGITLSPSVVAACRVRIELGPMPPVQMLPSTTTSIGSPTPATLRAARTGFSPR